MIRAFCLAALIVLPTSQAFGGFVNGVERFDGTQPDAETWEPFVSDISIEEATISQNDALTIDATPSGSLASYTTRERLVSIDGGVRADVTHTGLSGGRLHLRSSRTDGIGVSMQISPPESPLEFSVLGGFTIDGSGSFEFLRRPGGGSEDFVFQPEGQTLTYEILLLSNARARFSAFDPATGTLLGRASVDLPQPLDDDLSISLEANNGSARFDNVAVLTAIPLPAAFWPAGALLASIAGARFARRRRTA